MQTVELIAHRGESADAPENTLAAFRLAWERNIPAIELDVHLTLDGALVVCHDSDTLRTTGVRKLIKESALAELRELDAGRWKGTHWTGERLPTLQEALATIPEATRCFIEVKVGPEAIPAVADAVRTSGKRAEQLTVISFQADTVAAARQQLPELKAYYLASFHPGATQGWTPGADMLIQRAKEMDAHGLNLSAFGPVNREFVQQVKAAGLELYVWTVDDPGLARQMIAAGVDGITTNRAAGLRAEIG
jgi:glycerophosphoryl diester phosphodiesterase